MSGRRRRRFGKKNEASSKSFQTYEDMLEENDFSFSHTDIASNNTLLRDSLSSTISITSGIGEPIEAETLRFSIEASVGTIQKSQDDIISLNTSTSQNANDFKVQRKVVDTPTQPSIQKSYGSSLLVAKTPLSSYGSVNKQKLINEFEQGSQDADDLKNALKSLEESRRETALEEKVRGASTDVYAVQDAGSYRLGYEHCLYLCSTISSIKPCISEDSHKSHTLITANAACELASMMSKAKERSALLISSGETCNGALNAILSALSSAPVHIKYRKHAEKDCDFSKHTENNNHSNIFQTPPSTDASTYNFEFSSNIKDIKSKAHNYRTRSSRSKNKKHKNKVPESATNMKTPINGSSLTDRLSNNDSLISDNDSRVALALGVVAHFLTEEATSSIPIRDSIFKHERGLQGICRLIQFDPILHTHECEQENGQVEKAIKPETLPPTFEKSTTDGSDNCDVKSENLNKNAKDINKRKCDPTAYGRRKRKIKRIRQQLTDITEDIDIYQSNISSDDSKIQNNSNHHSQNLNRTSISSLLSFTSGISTETSIAKPKSIDSRSDPSLKKLQDALACVHLEYNKFLPNKSKFNETSVENLTAGLLAMNAVKSIISQKHIEKDEEICENILEDEGNPIDVNNPFYTNKALRESGSLLILADVIKNLLASTLYHIDSCYKIKYTDINQGQWKHLCELNSRINVLVSIVDEACCLTPGNRKELVEKTFVIEKLVQLVSKIIDFEDYVHLHSNIEATQPAVILQTCLIEILSSSLRTLTSLTHENFEAGSQLLSKVKLIRIQGGKISTSYECGFLIIFDVLNKMVKTRTDLDFPKSSKNKHLINDEKCIYDAIIFCLNTLTNVAETPTLLKIVQREILSSTVISNNDDEESDHKSNNGNLKVYCGSSTIAIEEQAALQWLSGWLVNETESYRELIMEGSYGRKKNDTKEKCVVHEERPLKKNEEESLVIAGNGFVLLACLMKDSQYDTNGNTIYCDTNEQKKINGVGLMASHVRHNILSQMPKSKKNENGGVNFMIKTLKAFLNFYHYSIGDLSVAVVEPVCKLIDELKKMI